MREQEMLFTMNASGCYFHLKKKNYWHISKYQMLVFSSDSVYSSFIGQLEGDRPFAGPGHVTYPPLKFRPSTFWVPEMKRAGKNK